MINLIKLKINQKFLKDNFNLNFINDDTLKIEFDETTPPYNRDIIEKKIIGIDITNSEIKGSLENIFDIDFFL